MVLERRRTGKLVLTGKLRLESPLRIGGEDFDTGIDLPVLRDSQGRPYIPGASLCGVLAHYFKENCGDNNFFTEAKDWFWGSDRNNENKDNGNEKLFVQSSLIISDASLMEKGPERCRISVRDGVKITTRGIAEDGEKYNYEIVEPGAIFTFKAEITLFDKHDEEFKKLVSFITNCLETGRIAIGAMTTKGFGRCRLEEIICWKYDFHDKGDVWNWLAGVKEERQKINLPTVHLKTGTNLKLTATFDIQNSLLIKSNFVETDSDAAHIKCNHCNILPGTSWKGALRSRMQRILNTLGFTDTETKAKLDALCGAGDDETVKKQKSRLILEETEIQQVAAEQQTRIKIDRFTGGTINNALYNAEPLWPQADKAARVEFKAGIKKCKPWEAGLLLLALKDLWSGDLALGGEKGIGRGVLKGIKAEIEFRDDDKEEKKYIIEDSGDGLKITGKAEDMEEWVQALCRECSGGAQS
jgi:CRISPR/Cas system CSM-associated protein Csm3 (group 7 of RAMP superfamily)